MSTPLSVDELSPSEQRAVDLIHDDGPIYQSELWKALEVSSRTGSRIARSLAEKNIIAREQTVHEGRTTYRLRLADGDTAAEEPSQTEARSETESEDEDEGESERGSESETDTDSALGTALDIEVTIDHESDMSERQQRALALIQARNGLYQSELWKALDVSSRTGTRIATALEDVGEIEREQTVHNGTTTYLLTPAPKDRDFSLLLAGNMLPPFVGHDGENVDPHSDAFSQWVLQLSHERQANR